MMKPVTLFTAPDKLTSYADWPINVTPWLFTLQNKIKLYLSDNQINV